MAKLKTETYTPEIEQRLLIAFLDSDEKGIHHGEFQANFEHGQWFVTCTACGAQWSVVDAEGGSSVDGFDFELITDGDEYCDEHEDW